MPSLVAQVDTHTRNEERTSASERGEDVGHRAKRSVAGPSVRPGSGDLWEVLGLDVDLSGHGASGFGGRGWESQAPRCPQGSARQSAGPANADGFGQITGESGPRAVRNRLRLPRSPPGSGLPRSQRGRSFGRPGRLLFCSPGRPQPEPLGFCSLPSSWHRCLKLFHFKPMVAKQESLVGRTLSGVHL